MNQIDKRYNEILDYLYNYLPHFSKKLGLENITNLLKILDNPQDLFKSVHVAGTNGKGSVCASVAAMLRANEKKVGVFTSPHLVDFRERMTINGEMIAKEKVVELIDFLKPMIKRAGATFFETIAAMAFLYFAQQDVDYAIIEVGMGGRLDATNLIHPEVAVITNISYDHMKNLGNTLTEIAGEKAGIIKSGVPVITAADAPEAFDRIKLECERKEVKLIDVNEAARWNVKDLSEAGTLFDLEFGDKFYEDLEFSLLGRHQVINAVTAVVTYSEIPTLEFRESDMRKGLKNTQWRGRLDLFCKTPRILLDGAHNPKGVEMLCNALDEVFGYDKLYLIFGVLEGKKRDVMLLNLTDIADEFIATQPNAVDRHIIPYTTIANEAKMYTPNVFATPNVQNAIDYALKKAKENDLICVAGSLYLVGEAMEYLQTLNLHSEMM